MVRFEDEPALNEDEEDEEDEEEEAEMRLVRDSQPRTDTSALLDFLCGLTILSL